MTLRLGDTLIAGSGANKDLSNLTSQGQNIANWSNNVTNCITEIPQDIKLELNNGTLTLKAGSKVYVPNGAGNFDVVTVSNDVVFHTGTVGSSTLDLMLCCNLTGGFGIRADPSFFVSGSTEPSNTSLFWYDTVNNMIKAYVNGVWVQKYSFPIGIYHRENGNAVAVKKVFNGFGYIGSAVFALPGVKGLIPNGRNEDGSLKNIEFTTSSVLTETQSWNFDWVVCTLYKSNDSIFIAAYGDPDLTFDENKNLFFFNGGVASACPFTKYRMQNGISNFTPKTAFHALDFNDKSTISGWSMPSSRYMDLTLLASGSQYTAPANGWLFFSKRATAANQEVYIADVNELFAWEDVCPVSGQYCQITVPWEKGHIYKVAYGLAGTTIAFRFIYAEGENV